MRRRDGQRLRRGEIEHHRCPEMTSRDERMSQRDGRGGMNLNPCVKLKNWGRERNWDFRWYEKKRKSRKSV